MRLAVAVCPRRAQHSSISKVAASVALQLCATDLAGALDERRELLRKVKARRGVLTHAEAELARDDATAAARMHKLKGAAKGAAEKVLRAAQRTSTVVDADAKDNAEEQHKRDSSEMCVGGRSYKFYTAVFFRASDIARYVARIK